MMDLTWLFSIIFYSITLICGVDFTITGILIFKTNILLTEGPKLLGLILLRRMIKNQPRKPNKLFNVFYAPKIMSYYTIIGGVMCILIGLLGLTSIIFDVE